MDSKVRMVMIALKDAETQASVSRSLRADGIETLEYVSVFDAVKELETRPADLIAIDLALCNPTPGIVIDRIHQAAPETRIVVCTSESDPKDGDVVEKGIFFYAAGIDATQLGLAIRAGLQPKGRRG